MEWVNPMYMDISYQEQIQEEFEENSEIQLKDFLQVFSHSFFVFVFAWPVSAGCFCLTMCLSSGGEVQGGEGSPATLSDSVDEERSA